MKDAIVRFLPASIMLALAVTIAWQSGYADELWAAWSVLAAYGAPVIVLACAVWWLVMRGRLEKEHQAIAGREAAASLQEENARNTMAEAERIRQAAHNQVQAAMEEVARREQEAAAQIENAEARMQGSVNTNIGRQRLIRDLKGQVADLQGELQELKKRVNGLKRRRTGG